MKHFLLWTLRILLIAAVVFGCYELTLYLSGQFDPPVMVGYLDAAEGAVWVDAARLEGAVTAQEIGFSRRQTAPERLPETARELCDAGARALVIVLNEPLKSDTAEELLALARERGTTLLFAGEDPGESALGEDDLAWYIGSDPALAGEVLGQRAAMLFREGDAPDLNEDHLLQYVWLADPEDAHANTLRRYILEECEHYGVYSTELDSLRAPAEELYKQALERWEALGTRPEIILCSGPRAAEAALQAADALGWRQIEEPQAGEEEPEEEPAEEEADEEEPEEEETAAARAAFIPILCAAPDSPAAHALVEDGTLAGCCYYDLDGVTDALALLAVNAAQREYVARDTELVPNGHEFLLPYLAVSDAG